ncbi:hypothetical protein ACLOJK_015155 [Asimina triloba]
MAAGLGEGDGAPYGCFGSAQKIIGIDMAARSTPSPNLDAIWVSSPATAESGRQTGGGGYYYHRSA